MKPILEIRHNRFIYLALAPIPLALAGLFLFLVFLSDTTSEFQDPTAAKIVFSFFILVGIFLSYHWFMRFLKDTPIFTIYEDGFESNTHGVSSGIIKWDNIRKIEEQLVREGRGQSAALAVYFKDPNLYASQQPVVVRILRSAVEKTGAHHAQRLSSTVEDDLPYLIPISDLGERYPQVKKLIEDKIAQHS